MAASFPATAPPVSRRVFLKASLCGAAGLLVYAGEIERHWLEVTRHDVFLRGLPAAFDGMRIAQLSDIHLDDFTEPFFLHEAIAHINRFKPDAVFITGDFVTSGDWAKTVAPRALPHCAEQLSHLECKSLYAVLGNHDMSYDPTVVTATLVANGITVLRNANLPLERSGHRIWLAGIDDPLMGHPNLDEAIPASIRRVPNEPVMLLCHGPDYADRVLAHPAGQSVDLMLSGHSHGGQIRLPLVGPLVLPTMGKKYVEGWFKLGQMQLYVNRGLGTIGVPFRFDCPPEVTFFTLRAGA